MLRAKRAAASLGRCLQTKITGGGSDANIFFEKGIPLGILGTGMREVHTTREFVRLDDMVRATELLIEIIQYLCEGQKAEGVVPLG